MEIIERQTLAGLFETILTPVNIEVLPNDVKVMADTPEENILFLKRYTDEWTVAQRARLPDGIRDSKVSNILIKFEYTESFNEDMLALAIGYDFFYKQAKQLSDDEVQTVLLNAETPSTDILERLGYSQTQFAGVYRSEIPIFDNILLLSLNDLSDEPHNNWMKCFASRKSVREQALKRLKALAPNVNRDLEYFMLGLSALWLNALEGEDMMEPPTPEEVTEMGKMWRDILLDHLTVEDMLARFETKDVLSHLKPAEIKDYLKQLKKQVH